MIFPHVLFDKQYANSLTINDIYYFGWNLGGYESYGNVQHDVKLQISINRFSTQLNQ